MVGQTSQTRQIHGNHGIRNQCMMPKVTNLKVKARKVRKVRRVKMVKTRKAILMWLRRNLKAQTAIEEAPSLPASFFATHHVGSAINVGEPEMTGRNLWRPGPHWGTKRWARC